MTDNMFGNEGVNAMSEMLQVNTTLTTLNLASVEEQEKNRTNYDN